MTKHSKLIPVEQTTLFTCNDCPFKAHNMGEIILVGMHIAATGHEVTLTEVEISRIVQID